MARPSPEADRADADAEARPAPRGYARMRAKEDAARASLEPLREGERPLVVTICALIAAGIAVANVALILAGWEIEGIEQPSLAESLAPAALMSICAAGLWLRRYWALLAFQVVLTITIVFAFLFLLRASNLQAVALCAAILAVAGTLFWFLVRAMARIQMPRDEAP